MQVTVNHDLCIGCSICANMCPSCFEMKDDMKSHIVEGCDVSDPCCEQSAGACPVQAIEISE